MGKTTIAACLCLLSCAAGAAFGLSGVKSAFMGGMAGLSLSGRF